MGWLSRRGSNESVFPSVDPGCSVNITPCCLLVKSALFSPTCFKVVKEMCYSATVALINVNIDHELYFLACSFCANNVLQKVAKVSQQKLIQYPRTTSESTAAGQQFAMMMQLSVSQILARMHLSVHDEQGTFRYGPVTLPKKI